MQLQAVFLTVEHSTSSETPSHLHGCVSWGYQPFALLTDRAGWFHLIETLCVIWDKMLRVEFYQSLNDVGRCTFPPATVTNCFFPTPLWQQQHQQTQEIQKILVLSSPFDPALALVPGAPTFNVVMLLRRLEATLFASLSQPAWVCTENLQQYVEKRKKSHLSLLLTLSEEIIQAASAEIFCCVTCISHRDFSWQDYVDHCFLNRDKVSQNLGTVSLQQINGCCIIYFNTGEKMGF